MNRLIASSRSVVAALAGRRTDAPGAAPRFPLDRVGQVRTALEALFDAENVGLLVCSAACGADLIALEIARRKAIRYLIVLPFAIERFRQSSVIDRPGNWGPLFDEVIDSVPASQLTVLNLSGEADDAYEAATREIVRQAAAAAAPATALAIAVWEGKGHRGTDATESFLHHAKQVGMSTRMVRTC